MERLTDDERGTFVVSTAGAQYRITLSDSGHFIVRRPRGGAPLRMDGEQIELHQIERLAVGERSWLWVRTPVESISELPRVGTGVTFRDTTEVESIERVQTDWQ